MNVKDIYNTIDFDSLPIDEFWNTGDEKENKMHRIHAYPAKFPAFITTKALSYANNLGIEVNQVADIFCGCGTTAYETSRNGINFWGCDINPVATLIATAKSKKYDISELNSYYSIIVKKQSEIQIDFDSLNVNDRISYWFKENNIVDLIKLKQSIELAVPQNSIYRNFFFCAFSNILKPTSMWLTKSIKPQYDGDKKPQEVMGAFLSQYTLMLNANKENQLCGSANLNIENINFLESTRDTPFVDLIVTSPPYVTSYEYADLHQLSTLWLGYSEDYREFRKGSIGSLYHNSDYKNDCAQLSPVGRDIIFELEKSDKNKAKSAAKYFVDMQKCVKKSYDILNEGGLALFVIGNTEYKGVKINNAKHLVESMAACKMSSIDVIRRKISKKILTPYRDEKGKFTNDSNSRKVYSEEFIVIGRKG